MIDVITWFDEVEASAAVWAGCHAVTATDAAVHILKDKAAVFALEGCLGWANFDADWLAAVVAGCDEWDVVVFFLQPFVGDIMEEGMEWFGPDPFYLVVGFWHVWHIVLFVANLGDGIDVIDFLHIDEHAPLADFFFGAGGGKLTAANWRFLDGGAAGKGDESGGEGAELQELLLDMFSIS